MVNEHWASVLNFMFLWNSMEVSFFVFNLKLAVAMDISPTQGHTRLMHIQKPETYNLIHLSSFINV